MLKRESVNRGLVNVSEDADGQWQYIEDLQGTLWAELDFSIEKQIAEAPAYLHEAIRAAYSWAKKENEYMAKEGTEDDEKGDWLWEYNQSRGKFL